MIPVFEEKEVAPIVNNDYTEPNKQEDNKVEAAIPLNGINSNLDINDHEEDILIEIPEPIASQPNDDKILRYFNLYSSGTYILTEDKPLEADYVIPIKANHQRGFLLQCYQSGHVNKVYISVLLSRRIGKEYMNGLNRDGQLVHIQAIDSEKIIGIYFNENGRRKFKAHLTENISCREQLHLQGYKVIYNDFKRIEYSILPLEIQNKISRLVFQSFTANGKPTDNNYYEPEWLTLKRFNIEPADKHISIEPTQIVNEVPNHNPYFGRDKLVSPDSVVKIRLVNIDKILIVKFVEYQTSGTEIVDGIQLINIKKPLAVTIMGRSVGDKVKISGTNTEIEIIEVYENWPAANM